MIDAGHWPLSPLLPPHCHSQQGALGDKLGAWLGVVNFTAAEPLPDIPDQPLVGWIVQVVDHFGVLLVGGPSAGGEAPAEAGGRVSSAASTGSGSCSTTLQRVASPMPASPRPHAV